MIQPDSLMQRQSEINLSQSLTYFNLSCSSKYGILHIFHNVSLKMLPFSKFEYIKTNIRTENYLNNNKNLWILLQMERP